MHNNSSASISNSTTTKIKLVFSPVKNTKTMHQLSTVDQGDVDDVSAGKQIGHSNISSELRTRWAQPPLSHNQRWSLERRAQMRAEARFAFGEKCPVEVHEMSVQAKQPQHTLRRQRLTSHTLEMLTLSDDAEALLRRISEYCCLNGIDYLARIPEFMTSRLSDAACTKLKRAPLCEKVWDRTLLSDALVRHIGSHDDKDRETATESEESSTDDVDSSDESSSDS